MRVLILGPVITSKTSGGVAVFDEGLYKGFLSIGDEANVISIEKSSSIDNLVVNIKKPKMIPISKRKIAKKIKEFKPDIVISSLQYSLGINVYKKMWSNAKYIQVLHGFPCPINGIFKSWIINKTAKYCKKYFDYTVTVSFLSFAINKKINKITCDKVIQNGCMLDCSKAESDRPYDFIYIGRLFRDKEVEMISDSFVKIKSIDPSLRLAVAGYGEMLPWFTQGKYKNTGIEFLGKLDQIQVKHYLEQSKFFISMNPLEPFGIVFGEAVVSGCNVVTQSSSGCLPLFIGKNYFHSADCIDSDELSKKLLSIKQQFVEISQDERKKFADYMSFDRVAKEYKDLVCKKN